MKKIALLILAITMVSCKSKAVLAEGKANDSIAAKSIIEKHYEQNNLQFNTLSIKANAKYEDDKQKQNVAAEIRIKKDEKILVIVRFLGVAMAKALITPNEVQYYERINGTYFEGDFQTLSKWLGTELNFSKIQNMLLGKPIDNLVKNTYKEEIVDNLYQLFIQENTIDKKFYFESERFLLKKQEITQPTLQRNLEVNYPSFQTVSKLIFPSNLSIKATTEKTNTAIDVDYKSITINDDVPFSYSVPSGYEKIKIK
jgi:hypothetical protein